MAPWPLCSAPLLQYVDILYKAYTCFTGSAWMHYSEEFKMKAVTNTALHWDQVHHVLWLQIMHFARPNLVEISHSGHTVQRFNTGFGPRPESQVVQPSLIC